MGWGAPLRDNKGHILAERGNIFDREPSVELESSTPKEIYTNFEDDLTKKSEKEGNLDYKYLIEEKHPFTIQKLSQTFDRGKNTNEILNRKEYFKKADGNRWMETIPW